MMHFEKMKARYRNEDVWKSFFCKLAIWNLATSLQINFFTDLNFQGFKVSFKILTITNGYMSFLYKMLEKHLWHSFLLFGGWNSATCTWNNVLYRRVVLQTVSKFSDKHKKQSSGGVLSKDVLKNFVKFTEKNIFAGFFFFAKLQAGNLKPVEAAAGDSL